jgi:hypothetical protein
MLAINMVRLTFIARAFLMGVLDHIQVLPRLNMAKNF